MLKPFAILAALGVLCAALAAGLLAQGKPAEPIPSYTVKGEFAEWKAPAGTTIDGLWKATLETLMLMRWAVLSSERASNTITARLAHSTFKTFGKPERLLPRVQILFTENAGECTVLAHWYIDTSGSINWGGWGSDRKAFYKEYFTKVVAALK